MHGLPTKTGMRRPDPGGSLRSCEMPHITSLFRRKTVQWLDESSCATAARRILRPSTPEDRPLLEAFFAELSDRDR
jgi:hypothetical protein